jgi:hypothetical protein
MTSDIAMGSMSDSPMGSLNVRLGTFERHVTASAEGTRRALRIDDCTVIAGWIGRDIHDAPLEIWTWEAVPDDPPVPDDATSIGTLNTSRMHANIGLPPGAFAQLWAAAAATDGATRNIHIELESEDADKAILAVTMVTLVEAMPTDGAAGQPGRSVPPRIHPVVVELRIMREKMMVVMRWMVIAIALVVTVNAVIGVLRSFGF